MLFFIERYRMELPGKGEYSGDLTQLIVIGALLVLFIIFRLVSREIERRRRLREEEFARQQAMRVELLEFVIMISREHPGDAARLIRMWLKDE